MTSKMKIKAFSTQKVRFSPIQEAIIYLLIQNGPMARSDLVRDVKTPRTTIYDNLLKLQQRDVIRKYSDPNPSGKRGRSVVYWEVI